MKFKHRKPNLRKIMKSIDKFIDIKEIYNDGILLKDNSYITGLKIIPFDIWVASDFQARTILNNLRYAFNQINFPVYQAFVYTPSTFETMENNLIAELDNANEQQKTIILDDLDKIEEFTQDNKKVEFFVLIKDKNMKDLTRKYEDLRTELSRAFIIRDLYYSDFIAFCNWSLDIDSTILTQGYYHGNNLNILNTSFDDITSNESFYDDEATTNNHHSIIGSNLYTIEEKREHFIINDKYCTLILVKGLPKEYEVGLFNYVGKNQDIKTFFITQESDLDLIKHVKSEYKSLKELYDKACRANDILQRDELSNKLNSLDEFSQLMVSNKDRTIDVSLAFIVSHYDYKEMQYVKKKFTEELRTMGFSVLIPKYLQLALFKYFNPIFKKDYMLNSIQEFNIGFPLSTTSFALTYPYHFSTCEDSNGFLYGYERNMNGKIVFNPFFYKDNEKIAVKENRLNGNIILLGEAGSGKTSDLFLFIRYFIRRKTFIMWIDPENQNKKYTLANGGSYLEFGSDKFLFNPFQLIRVSSDDDDINFDEIWNTKQAIINAIDLFKNFLTLYCKQIDDNTLNMVGMVANRMYEKRKITNLKTFEHLSNTDYPIVDDFAETLSNFIIEFKQSGNIKFLSACEDLMIKITPLLEEHRHLVNGHTTFDVDMAPGKMIGIGTKKLYLKSKNVQDAMYYIIYNHAFNFCLDPNVDTSFVYDEAHRTMNNEMTVELLDQFTRRSRKYKNITLLGTQEPLDLNKPNMQGIINNSTYIIVKMLTKDNALRTLKDMIGVENDDLAQIKGFGQGDSYFRCGKKSYYMHTLLTEKEIENKGNNY